MSVSDTIRMALNKCNKSINNLSKEVFGKDNPQFLYNKLYRATVTVPELSRIATYTGGQLEISYPDGSSIPIDISEPRHKSINKSNSSKEKKQTVSAITKSVTKDEQHDHSESNPYYESMTKSETPGPDNRINTSFSEPSLINGQASSAEAAGMNPSETVNDSMNYIESNSKTSEPETVTFNPLTEITVVDYSLAKLDKTPKSLKEFTSLSELEETILCQKVETVLNIEAPIVQDRLIRIILESYGFQRSQLKSKKATAIIEEALKKHGNRTKLFNNYVCWTKNQTPQHYTQIRKCQDSERDLVETPPHEIALAICFVLKAKHDSMKQNILKKEVCTLFGYNDRSAITWEEAFSKGLKYAVRQNWITASRERNKTITLLLQ